MTLSPNTQADDSLESFAAASEIQLLVFDTHPDPYRVPIWQALHKASPSGIHVVFASKNLVKNTQHSFFEQSKEDLEGFPHTLLSNERKAIFWKWNALSGKGIRAIIKQLQPQAILLTDLAYKFNAVALLEAKKANIPVHLRYENQEETSSKKRSPYHKWFYRSFTRFYYIGQLNKQHYLNQGIEEEKLIPARFCTVNHFNDLTKAQKRTQKEISRGGYGFEEDSYIIGFSGQLIPPRNPAILFELLDHLPVALRSKVVLYFAGSGESQANLMMLAAQYYDKYETRSIFTGFVKPSQMAQHYLTLDMLILPAQKSVESWGATVNEAMQAGCSVVVSNFVGCSADFKDWERFEVFQEGDVTELAQKVQLLMSYERNFDWANERLKAYSIENCVHQILDGLTIKIPTLNPSTLSPLKP